MAPTSRMRQPMRLRGPALAVVCVALLGACSPGTDADADGAAAPEQSVLDVSGRSLDGGEVDLGSFAGERLVLWMWAPW